MHHNCKSQYMMSCIICQLVSVLWQVINLVIVNELFFGALFFVSDASCVPFNGQIFFLNCYPMEIWFCFYFLGKWRQLFRKGSAPFTLSLGSMKGQDDHDMSHWLKFLHCSCQYAPSFRPIFEFSRIFLTLVLSVLRAISWGIASLAEILVEAWICWRWKEC